MTRTRPLALPIADAPRVLKTTTSRCPDCGQPIPAEVVSGADGVRMLKTCPDDGAFEVLLARDPAHYHLALGAQDDGGCDCGGTCGAPAPDGADPFDVLSTCVALIEIVDSCNLACPTCYAASPRSAEIDCTPLPDIVERLERVLDRKGAIDILQLSGGEPTLHPQFLDVLDWTLAEPRIGYVLVNTNGVRIAQDEAFLHALAERRKSPQSFELYLQFDGPQAEGQLALRGADLRTTRTRAIDGAGALGVPTTLAMVVTPETLPAIGDALRFGVERPHCRGITFQPVFTSGRVPVVTGNVIEQSGRRRAPISVGGIVAAISAQAPELLACEDFTPLPCGDPNCHTIAYMLRTDHGTVGLGALLDLPVLQQFLGDRLDYRLDDLARCGCDTEPLGQLLHGLELGADAPFRVFIKPFMDAWTFDQDRIDRCCTHVVRADGSLDSFCRHYLDRGA